MFTKKVLPFMRDKLLVFSGNSHPELAQDICQYLNIELGEASITRFPDGEIDIKITSDVRDADIFVIQSTCTPGNENLMELLILIDCLKRASAGRITSVIPYYGYARKDRKDEGRVPITAKLVANLLTTAKTDRLLTVDLHADQIQGFLDIPVDHLLAWVVFIPYFMRKSLGDLAIVSPDVGSIKQARSYAKKLGGDLAVVDKRRDSPESVKSMHLIGEVKDKDVIIVDDMISTGGSITEACKLVKSRGAKDVYLCATHPVLCGSAIEKLGCCEAKEIVVSDTIPVSNEKRLPNMRIISLAPLLGEAIRRIHYSESISFLFRSFEKFLH